MTEHYQIQEYSKTAAAIAILREKYSSPFDVATTKGMESARQARAEVRGYRVALEKLRQEIKAPALERTRLIDAEAKRITAELLAIEEPIDAAIKAEETRKAEERAAKERAEAARVAAIQARIAAIRHCYTAALNKTAAEITLAIEAIESMQLAVEDFAEFITDANAARGETGAALMVLRDEAIKHEEEQARIIAEREELARLRAAEAARRAEQARKDEEIRQQQAAETARLKAEQEAMERQRAELEAKERAFEEQAKVAKLSRKGKTDDPVADLKQALNASPETAKALDEAYQRGYQAGLTAAQRVA